MLIWLGSLFVYIHGLEGGLIIVNVFMNCGLLFHFIMARASSHLLSNTSFFSYLLISF